MDLKSASRRASNFSHSMALMSNVTHNMTVVRLLHNVVIENVQQNFSDDELNSAMKSLDNWLSDEQFLTVEFMPIG